MRRKQILLLGLAVLLPGLAAPAAALPKVQGTELRVSSPVAAGASLRHPVAAFTTAGSSLVAWEDDRAGIVGRFFGADSAAQGAAVTLVANHVPTLLPYKTQVTIAKEPAIAFLPSGQFFLFWTEETNIEEADLFFIQDTLIDHEVFGRLFNASGTPAGERFRVHANSAGFQGGARALVRSGDVVVAWSTSRNPVFPTNGAPDGVFIRTFDFSGNATSPEIRVSPAGTRSGSPAIAGARGKFLVAFDGSDGNGRGVFAQPYTAALAPIGSLVQVNTATERDQRRPAVAADVAGNYLVVWQSQVPDVRHARVYGQQLGANGNLIGSQIAVSKGADQYEVAPSVAVGAASF
ncbi:MAG TPA: hypothetical protein VGR07_11055, partial [Thermoanaerobaculia bacterium]|nr:hypothetical protein [Thermoanaerobaculia bacterium]